MEKDLRQEIGKDENIPTIQLFRENYNTFRYEATDNLGIIGYAVVKDSAEEPTEWNFIKATTNLKDTYTINSAGEYYFWITDSKNVAFAKLVADNIAHNIENRVSFRVAQKKAIRNTMKAGAKGIKTLVSGRLGGADIARGEGYSEGTIPLHTLRADIDYATAEADTTYGKIGVKVWIYKGEVLSKGGNSNVNAKKN